MDIIEQYISALFSKLPATLDILHLKDEVTADALRTFTRLCDEGMDSNTAIGTVLSSLGSLSDILARHGMEYPMPVQTPDAAAQPAPEAESLSDEVEDYLYAQYNIARMNALGVGLCILSPCFPMLFDGAPRFLGHWISEGLAGVGLFGAIAFAVMLFIYASSMQKSWRGFPHIVQLTAGMREELRRREADYNAQRTEHIALGVGLCIFSPAPAIFFDSGFGAMLMFAFIAVGVYLLILSGVRTHACRKLLKNS